MKSQEILSHRFADFQTIQQRRKAEPFNVLEKHVNLGAMVWFLGASKKQLAMANPVAPKLESSYGAEERTNHYMSI